MHAHSLLLHTLTHTLTYSLTHIHTHHTHTHTHRAPLPIGKWHTWIDYPKFDMLMKEYYASGGAKSFTSEDYMAETPGR